MIIMVRARATFRGPRQKEKRPRSREGISVCVDDDVRDDDIVDDEEAYFAACASAASIAW